MTSANSFIQAAGDAYVRRVCWLVDASRRAAWWVLLSAVLLTAGSAYFVVNHFAINPDTSGLLSSDLPFQQLDAEFDRAFPNLSGNILVVIDGQTAALARQAASRLAHWFEQRPKLFSAVYRPTGGKFFIKNGLLYLEPKALKQLSTRLSQAQPFIAQLAQDPSLRGLLGLLGQALKQQAASGEALPGLVNLIRELTRTIKGLTSGSFYQVHWERLIFGEARAQRAQRQLILVKPRPEANAARPLEDAITAAQHAARSLGLTEQPGVRVRLTGSAVLKSARLQTATTGMTFATLLSLSLIIILLLIGLRNWRLVLATLVTLIAGLIWTTAFALAAIGPFNIISIAFAVLFVGIGVDFSIQFCMRYREDFSYTHELPSALYQTAHNMGGALTLAAMAAAASFYSFVPTNYAGIIDLGLIAGTGMLIALFANLTLLPALLKLLRAYPRVGYLKKRFSFAPALLKRNAWGITVAAVLAGLAATPLAIRIHFDFNPTHLMNPDAEAVKTLRSLLAESKRSPYTIEILQPNLAAAQQLAERIAQLPSVAQTVTLASFVPENQAKKLEIIRRMAIIIPPFTLLTQAEANSLSPTELQAALDDFRAQLARWHPSHKQSELSKAIAALRQAINKYQMRFGDNPKAIMKLQRRVVGALPAELNRLRLSLQAQKITLNDLPQELRTRYLAPNGRARVQVFSSLNLNRLPALSRFVTQVRDVAPQAIGVPVMLKKGGDAVLKAFRQASLIAAAAILVLLLVVLRNLRDTLLALAPLGLAGLLTVASMEVVNIPFNLANIIVVPLIVGLGISFGIYFVLRWRRGEHMDKVLLSSTPAAILFSALTTMSSFGSLAVAPDAGVAMLGRTLSIALGWILICTLVVLPAALILVAPSRNYD